MFKLVVLLVLAFVAVASAVYTYDEAYLGAGAYGHHGPFAVSYTARVDAPRQDIVSVATVPYAYHHAYHHF